MNQLPEKSDNIIASSEVETLGVKAVSKSLGVSRATVLRWIRANKIEGFFRIGSKWLIRKIDFDNFINSKINTPNL
jgi:excisionase family DNA binding protein